MNTLIAELLTTDEGLLPNPVLVLNWSRNLSFFPEVAFPDICNYLLGKADEYSAENLKSFKSLTGYRLFKDRHVMDLKTHEVPVVCSDQVLHATNRKVEDWRGKRYLQWLCCCESG